MSESVIIEIKAKALHEHISSKPTDTFAGKPRGLVKDAKIEVSKQYLERIDPPPKALIGFGGYVGASAIAWGAILRELNGAGSAVGIKAYTFELSSVNASIARDFIRRAGLEDIVHVEGSAAHSLRILFEEGRLRKGGMDVAFSDYWEKFYLPDLQLCEDLSLFRKGSKVIADNTDFPGAPAYLEYVKAGGRQRGPYRYESESVE
ncbi:putative O-methyltransferase [Aspergillus alliaceus]|uniref:putative O-methyltransferase n=1 Tax=Petromyces alliaceus TaxID=209559 RepID=UPI0012A6A773|nr:uncharacterized protein BDW43DRAFT_301375 [Aspergillus alliaceus]KAB8231953.1 hypothetical protein BDW43DRAFT_301375 [Aspergillus alliaceus]